MCVGVCAPGLGIAKAKELARHPLIHFEWRNPSERTPSWPRWFTQSGLPYPKQRPKLVFSDETHAIQAAVAGQGVVLASLALVDEDLASGALVQPFGPIVEHQAFHLVIPAEGAQDDTACAVRDWLLAQAERARRTLCLEQG
jgi:LysR family transcriptional regulator, glycine cleavage system transcriptional activator